MFCVECGKETTLFKNGLCINCYIKTHTFTRGPISIDLPVCIHCGAYKYKNTWTTDLFRDVLRRIVKNVFYISKDLKKIDISLECRENKKEIKCKVYISGFLNNVEVTERHNVLVHLKKTVCDVCSKRFGGYHEAIIQIRATDNRRLTAEELKNIRLLVENHVENLRTKGNRTLFITGMQEEHGGLDFYISDKRASFLIAKKIQEEYSGYIKKSSKNIGMREGRQIHRMTYLVRLPSYKKGDFLEYDNSFFYVATLHSDRVKLINLSNWEETIMNPKILQKTKTFGGKELIKEMILVSETKDEIQVMTPESYEIKTIKKPKPVKINSEKIKVVEIKNQLFLFLL
ncbi:MAG: hypothetical protein DRM99_04695 [Thermoplasmata archaeon]|nr:MAG: hypothetical protein DRM99_04695 [Thermoplasmata archaeon]RLF51379.1 MAG: hypothetical protein DRN24_05090 [Thermoplasmata archaeon]